MIRQPVRYTTVLLTAATLVLSFPFVAAVLTVMAQVARLTTDADRFEPAWLISGGFVAGLWCVLLTCAVRELTRDGRLGWALWIGPGVLLVTPVSCTATLYMMDPFTR